uniref:Uncharacterized protein n=1 Tax=Biomphalaria glabrata TaxID=6526 RepID=A0A2C9LJQ7_BIOGL
MVDYFSIDVLYAFLLCALVFIASIVSSYLTEEKDQDYKGPLIGDHENQESEGGESDLQKYFADCKKNPGHKQFIPVNTFTRKHLPWAHRDNDLYEYIRAVADLTVRVAVTTNSPNRPMFWPQTTHPYPFFSMHDTKHLRTGSGRVWCVNKFQNGDNQHDDNRRSDKSKCWCRKCQDSDAPSNVWWEFKVYTAAQVVFDDLEASFTTIRLFYDTEDSPVIIVDNVSVSDINILNDKCELKCVTCDTNLGNKLMIIWEHLNNVRSKVFEKFYKSSCTDKFCFIVSHPHGCSKQISVGQWKFDQKVGEASFSSTSKYLYTTCTCPGSSGGNVQCFSSNVGTGLRWSSLVHSGSLKSGLNYSEAH